MILEQLTLNNFRIFEGEHDFDLSPRVKYGKRRPIILFGGLNGAGKTTILNAVRLALYGRQSLRLTASQKEYDQYLLDSINHNAKETSNTSEIKLSFTYGHLGKLQRYQVRRSWVAKGKSVKESLVVSRDNDDLSSFSKEQYQAFLNELVPIGVSDLFFFDGEKISDLASDEAGNILEESIKKLLGLDLIDTLGADLAVLQRSEAKKQVSPSSSKQIAKLESELEALEREAENHLVNYEEARKAISQLDASISKLEINLLSSGGAWSSTREKAISELATQEAEERNLRAQINTIFAGTFPLSIATEFSKLVTKQLEDEINSKQKKVISDSVSGRLDRLHKILKRTLTSKAFLEVTTAIESQFNDLIEDQSDLELLHDISETQRVSVISVLSNAKIKDAPSIKQLKKDLRETQQKIERLKVSIAKSPTEEKISPIFNEMKEYQKKREKLKSQQILHLDMRKKSLRDAIDITRQLDKWHASLEGQNRHSRVLDYAAKSRLLLSEFSTKTTKRKISDLECELIASLQRLSRKEDSIVSAKIDPSNFEVNIFDKKGNKLEKGSLSAGEKQIYAIAMLEALARTSGRKLPIIVDTPLGRLDSIHRDRLINNYFPHASHQVIILSTDTEVDNAYYNELSRHISHAYSLNFSEDTRSTVSQEGYFWKEAK